MEAAADPLAAARPVSAAHARAAPRGTSRSPPPLSCPQCLQLYAPAVPWSSVDACAGGGLGHRLMHANAAMTRALSPAHLHVPWVTFDGVKGSALQG